ncbi:MAG: flagellar hook capping FlgD N-terminal domain-containing protein [Hydrogenophaga sp.]|nr:flagellar hook capping FlgD N-terminal domain-containing protein [Hydrogenophaga sp.]
MVDTVSNTASSNALATSGAASAASKQTPQEMQDRFLKLMVAQLSNQDPLNPMDNAELTTQMAQINTVTGIQQLNDSLKAMTSQFGTLQAMQGTSLIGRTAVVNGNTLGFDAEGDMAHGGVLLQGAADSVKVDVLGLTGQVLGSVDMGGLPAGQHRFDWDSAGIDRSLVGGFRVTATRSGEPVAANPLAMLRVESVGMVDGSIRLRTEGQMAYAYGDVLAFQ